MSKDLDVNKEEAANESPSMGQPFIVEIEVPEGMSPQLIMSEIGARIQRSMVVTPEGRISITVPGRELENLDAVAYELGLKATAEGIC